MLPWENHAIRKYKKQKGRSLEREKVCPKQEEVKTRLWPDLEWLGSQMGARLN